MIELKDGIILSKDAPKDEISFSLDKGSINVIPLAEKYKFSLLKLKDQALDKGSFKIDDVQIYPSEDNNKTLFFLQVNSLVKLGLCFVCEKENKKKKVKEIQESLVALRDLPTSTIDEKNAKIAAIFAKIRELLPSYVLADLNDIDDELFEKAKEELEQLASDILVAVLEKKIVAEEAKTEEMVEEQIEGTTRAINIDAPDDVIEKEAEMVTLDIGQEIVEAKPQQKQKEDKEEDFIIFDISNKSFGKCLSNTFKNNTMVFLSFVIPTTGVIAFLLLSPIYYQTQNKVLLIPFIITIVICFVLYYIMTYKCTKFYANTKDPGFKRKMGIFNVFNVLVTLLGIGLGVGIYILFKNFDAELKLITTTNILGILLAIGFSIILLTANLYIFVIINKIKHLFKRKK